MDVPIFLAALAFSWAMKFPYLNFWKCHKERGTCLAFLASKDVIVEKKNIQKVFPSILLYALVGARLLC